MSNLETTTRNKEIYQRYLQEVFTEGKLELLDELLTSDYVFRDAPPGTPPGADGIRQVVAMFQAGFSDFKIVVDDIIAEGDLVCVRATTSGIHTGEIFGAAPTGKKVSMSGLTMVRLKDGKIAESWVKNDVMGLMQQLGAEKPT